MRLCIAIALLGLLGDVATLWTFDHDAAGKLPPGWSQDKTGLGAGSVWKVTETDDAKSGRHVLAQTSSEGPNSFFNLCVADDTSLRDVDLSLDLRPISGNNDRGGGLVWRYRDHDNYYLCRWNPLEDNFRLYTVIEGKRSQLKSADVKLPGGWHTIRVVQQGEHIRCWLDGRQSLEARDATFADAGKVGLWSKSDAVTYFDNLSVGMPKD